MLFRSGSIENTDRGTAQISEMNKSYIYSLGALLSCGRIGKSLDNRPSEFY
jgi:hypothetical protein